VDGNFIVGLTAYACSLAGEIVSCTPKKVVKAVEKDKSCATVESGKWLGPVKTPVAVNDAVAAKSDTINQDPCT
jgi:glycine cleavage system H protein